MKNRIFYIAMFLQASFFAMAQQAFSLEQAVSYGLQQSAAIRTEQLNVLDADGQLLEYKSIGIPKVTADLDYAYFIDIPTLLLPDFVTPSVYGVLFNEGLLDPRDIPGSGTAPAQFGKGHNVDASISMTTMLFDFSWIQGLKAQELFRDLVKRNVTSKEYEVKSAITKAYLAVLIAERNANLLDNNISNLENLYAETEATYQSGFVEKLDVDRIELSLENLKTEHQNVSRFILISKNLLKFQMGYPLQEEIVLTDEFDIVANQIAVEAVELAGPVDYNLRPEMAALTLTEELNKINIKALKAGYMPSLRGRASYSQVLQRDKLFDSEDSPWFPTSIVGVTLSVPIFDGLEKSAKIERARINLDKATIRTDEFKRSVDMQVQNGRIQYQNAKESVSAREKTMLLAQRIYDVTQIKYREGAGSSLEVSQAESELYQSQTNYINALYDLIVAKTDLDIALGNL